MTTDINEQLSENSIRHTLAEISSANEQLSASMVDGAVVHQDLSEKALNAVSESQIAAARERARLQRARGRTNLARRHEGVASIIMKVDVYERIPASSFERFLAPIENGIYVLTKRGEQIMGEARAEKLLGALFDMITALEDAANTDLAKAKLLLAKLSDDANQFGSDIVTPAYTSPAASHEVQLRTKHAKRVLDALKKQDEVMVILTKLSWNDACDDAQIDTQGDQIKRGMRDLASFLRKTINGMQTRVMPAALDVPSAPAANDVAQTEAAPEPVEQAA